MNALIVEDSPQTSILMRCLLPALNRMGFESRGVSTLHDALDQLASRPVDIVLLELRLSDDQELDAFLQFARTQRTIPIIVLTKRAGEKLAIEVFRPHAQGHWIKTKIHETRLLPSLREGLIQTLSSLRLQLKILAEALQANDPTTAESLQQVADETQVAAHDVRRVSRDLQPMLNELAFEQLLSTIRAVAAGKTYNSPQPPAERIISKQVSSLIAPEHSLTARQLEVLQLIAAGDTSKRIARKLRIHIKTVDIHRRMIRDRLNVASTPEMIRVAKEQRLI